MKLAGNTVPVVFKSAPVAQLDRAPDYESGGQEFESLRVRHLKSGISPHFPKEQFFPFLKANTGLYYFLKICEENRFLMDNAFNQS